MDAQEQLNTTISLGAFNIRILGRQFPDADDYWDGNWLVVDVGCRDDKTSRKRLSDACLRTDELGDLNHDIAALLASGPYAKLNAMEPHVKFEVLSSDRAGDVAINVSIRQNDMDEHGVFSFYATRDEIHNFAAQLENACALYPVKGAMNVH